MRVNVQNHYIDEVALLMPVAETIKALASFILKGVDLRDHTSIFLLHSINYNALLMCAL